MFSFNSISSLMILLYFNMRITKLPFSTGFHWKYVAFPLYYGLHRLLLAHIGTTITLCFLGWFGSLTVISFCSRKMFKVPITDLQTNFCCIVCLWSQERSDFSLHFLTVRIWCLIYWVCFMIGEVVHVYLVSFERFVSFFSLGLALKFNLEEAG